MFKEYRLYLERKHRGKVIEINFCDKKKYGWSVAMRYIVEKSYGKRKEYVYNYHRSEYLLPFLKGLLTRESCYKCPFSSMHRPGDLTLGDFFGFQHTRPELEHKEGLSLILVNSEKGHSLLNVCKSLCIHMTQVDEHSVRMSGTRNLYAPTERPIQRDRIYVNLNERGVDYVIKTYFKPRLTFRQKLGLLLPKYILNRIKFFIN